MLANQRLERGWGDLHLGFGWKEGAATIEVIPNYAHVPDIPAELEERYRIERPKIPGFLIKDHGITAWGCDLSTTRNYIELFSYIFSFMCKEY